MADWDPFAIDDPGATPIVPADAKPTSKFEPESRSKSGSGLDQDSISSIVRQLQDKFEHMETRPWLDFEKSAQPDLSLHTPACSADDWKHKDVEFVIGKGIAYIILNRPDENNAITDSVHVAYNDAVHALHKRSDIRVVVLTARGKMFCSGVDPRWDGVPTQERSGEALKAADALMEKAVTSGICENKEQAAMTPFMKSHYNFCALPQLTVAIVNGSVMGQGLGYVCSCDVIISMKSAFFSLSDVKLGLVPSIMAPYLLMKAGNNHVKRMMVMGESMDAQKANSLGVVQHVVSDLKEAQGILKDICERVTSLSPDALREAKRLTYGLSGRPVIEECMWYSLKYLNESFRTSFKSGEEQPWKNVVVEVLEPPPW